MKFEMNSRDFQFVKFIAKDGTEVEKLELKPVLAYDEDFKQEMRTMGVKDKALRQEEEEE